LTKIFGVGLSRTGTTSLHAAAVLLGFSAIHYPLRLTPNWIAGNFSPATIGPFAFYTDLPVPVYFREFDRACPGSRFILTSREPSAWADSVENWFAKMPPSSPRTAQRDIVRLVCYGVHNFHRQRFLDVYRRHTDEVIGYFRDRPDDLLVLDLTTQASPWEPLCRFLGKPEPERVFPHLRTPAIGNLQFVLEEEIGEKKRRMVRLLEEDARTRTAG
jgi:Sulfotransferase domain